MMTDEERGVKIDTLVAVAMGMGFSDVVIYAGASNEDGKLECACKIACIPEFRKQVIHHFTAFDTMDDAGLVDNTKRMPYTGSGGDHDAG